MTQAAVQPAPSPATPAPAQPTIDTVVARPGPPAAMSTPQRLRWLSTGLVAAGVIVGLVGALTFTFLAYAINRAEAETAQLIRVQTIQTNLLSADATATNAFLVGGLEPADQRAAYDRAIADTSGLIAQAAQAQPADTEALAALNQQLTAYAATIEQARANNRQGLPVGAQYLRTASAQLRAGALPILDNLVSANARRAGAAMNLNVGYVFVVIAVVGLAAMVAGHFWLARRFRRRINPGVLAGAAVLLVALVIGVVATQQIGAAVTTTKDGSFRAVNVAADARIAANDAKSNESLTLIARGSGASFDQAWTARAEEVRADLARLPRPGDLGQQWAAYTDVHATIRQLDDSGAYDRAVQQATSASGTSANTTFNAFDTQLSDYLDAAGSATATELADRQPGLVITAILTLLAGLAAALLGRAGIGVRLREYR